MLLSTEQDYKKFSNALNEVRKETGHKSDTIEIWQWNNLKWIWRMTDSKDFAKKCMIKELGW